MFVVLPVARVPVRVREYNSVHWAEVAKGKGATWMASNGVATAYPVQYLPF